ncbi:MAG: bifunctional adenosylcobinamide kinase/adenosylcobinamide-phosphate guanylyltransferase [Pseudomonadota bacterium]
METIPAEQRTLVLGGARSGKSAHAERRARETGRARVYIATAEAWDEEMRERIARHRADRGAGWTTVEAPHDLVETITTWTDPARCVLVDCLTLWLSNRLLAEADLEKETDALCAAIEAATGPLICVSNEVGLGLVPETPLGRRFRDAQGRVNQRVAEISDRVEFVAAGLPLVLKGKT